MTGSARLPVLDVDGQPIVGSDLIIQWLAAQESYIRSLSHGRSRSALNPSGDS